MGETHILSKEKPGDTHSFSVRVRVLRAQRHLSQPEFAELMGFSRNVVSAVENGAKPSKRFLQQLESLEQLEASPSTPPASIKANRPGLGDSSRFSVGEAPYDPNIVPLPRRIPLVSWAQAGEAVDYDELPPSWQKVVPTDIDDPKAFAITIVGDSMEPRYHENDVAMLTPSKALRQNDAVVARLVDQGVVFNLCSRSGDVFRFSSYNPAYLPFEVPADQVVWVYPVHSVLKIVNK